MDPTSQTPFEPCTRLLVLESSQTACLITRALAAAAAAANRVKRSTESPFDVLYKILISWEILKLWSGLGSGSLALLESVIKPILPFEPMGAHCNGEEMNF